MRQPGSHSNLIMKCPIKAAVCLLSFCFLLAIGSSLVPKRVVAARTVERPDPLLLTSQIVAELHGFENTDRWHAAFDRHFADGSTCDREQIERIAGLLRTMGDIARIEVMEAGNNPGRLAVQVRFKPSGAGTVSERPPVAPPGVIFNLTTNGVPRIVSIQLGGC